MNALSVRCPACLQSVGMSCINILSHIEREPHESRQILATAKDAARPLEVGQRGTLTRADR